MMAIFTKAKPSRTETQKTIILLAVISWGRTKIGELLFFGLTMKKTTLKIISVERIRFPKDSFHRIPQKSGIRIIWL